MEGDDIALPKFGMINPDIYKYFNYFASNLDISHELTIKRSFFNVAKHNDLFSDYLIFETKTRDQLAINEQVFIENHDIIMKDIDLRREKYFNIKLLESYSSFISKFETVYNNTVVGTIF